MGNDTGSKWARLGELLSKVSTLGTLGIFVVNFLFVLALAYIYAKWDEISDSVSKFAQIAIIVLAFICIMLVPFIYLIFRYVDEIIIPRKLGAKKGKGKT